MDRKIIFRCRTGSHLYGLNTPESDEDFMSVFLPNPEDILGLQKCEIIDNSTKSSASNERNTKDDIDDKFYSLPKYLHLLLQNNPNIVETLFVTPENIIICEPEFQFLIDNYNKIISQKVYYTFTGYAFSQKKKLEVKSTRYNSLVEACKLLEDYYFSEIKDPKSKLSKVDAEILNTEIKYYKGSKGNCNSFHIGMPVKDIYEQLCNERDEYGWRVKTKEFDKLHYDPKFAYHLIRILVEGWELLKYGRLEYPISDVARDLIILIKQGEIELPKLYSLYNYWSEKCNKAKEETKLPYKPDFNYINNWLVTTMLNHFKDFNFEGEKSI
jgi:predicted nucleotidyltransferase